MINSYKDSRLRVFFLCSDFVYLCRPKNILNMRKNIIVLLILLMCGITYANAQHFNDYFVDKTLRINYLHIGNKNTERLQIDHFTLVNHWNGTRSQLVEPYHYGDILIEVLDNASQKLIYSRSYSCLFTEYRTTERGETERLLLSLADEGALRWPPASLPYFANREACEAALRERLDLLG